MFCDQKTHVQIMNCKRLEFSIPLVDLGGAYPSDQVILHFKKLSVISANRIPASPHGPPSKRAGAHLLLISLDQPILSPTAREGKMFLQGEEVSLWTKAPRQRTPPHTHRNHTAVLTSSGEPLQRSVHILLECMGGGGLRSHPSRPSFFCFRVVGVWASFPFESV